MIINLYVAIQKALFNDPQIQALMGFDPADLVSRAKRIQKRSDPQDLAIDIMPLIAFYAVSAGGLDPRNSLTYDAIFLFDVYTNDDVSLAHDISHRILEMFHAEISPFEGVENFETLLLNQYESRSDLENTYAFTTALKFSIAMEK